jgi:hypothetical protein
MDKDRMRDLAGITDTLPGGATLEFYESATVSGDTKTGPNVLVSVGDRFGGELDVREANISSFRVKVATKNTSKKVTDDNFREVDKADKKIAEKKLKEIMKLALKFESDIEKVLKK